MAEANNEVKVEKGSSPITKIILFGIPAFIVQLILVYFVTANILMNKVSSSAGSGHETEVATQDTSKHEGGAEGEATGQFLYTIDEFVVNPANSYGRQLLLTSIAIDIASEEAKTKLTSKDLIIKDMIISVLSSKSVKDLSNLEIRDSLKTEIGLKIEGFLPEVKINKVYFSKFILQ
jgi:flagellar FliL protein